MKFPRLLPTWVIQTAFLNSNLYLTSQHMCSYLVRVLLKIVNVAMRVVLFIMYFTLCSRVSDIKNAYQDISCSLEMLYGLAVRTCINLLLLGVVIKRYLVAVMIKHYLIISCFSFFFFFQATLSPSQFVVQVVLSQ